MADPIYTHLCRSYDGAGTPKTTWHTSLAQAVAEQAAREADGYFKVVVMPVTTEPITLSARRSEVVTAYRAAPGTRNLRQAQVPGGELVEPTRKQVAA